MISTVPANSDVVFCITAMARPEILDKTLQSFQRNLVDITMKKHKVRINIDPYNDDKSKQQETLDVARKYFGYTESNLTDVGNFAKAVKFVWSNLTLPYVFHLEDDWELLEPIKVVDMKFFMKEKGCHQVALRAYDKARRTRYGYMCCLSPSLIKSEFCTLMSTELDDNRNPELYMKRYVMNHNYHQNDNTVYPYPNHVILQDLGREWMRINGVEKLEGEKFNKWVR